MSFCQYCMFIWYSLRTTLPCEYLCHCWPTHSLLKTQIHIQDQRTGISMNISQSGLIANPSLAHVAKIMWLCIEFMEVWFCGLWISYQQNLNTNVQDPTLCRVPRLVEPHMKEDVATYSTTHISMIHVRSWMHWLMQMQYKWPESNDHNLSRMFCCWLERVFLYTWYFDLSW